MAVFVQGTSLRTLLLLLMMSHIVLVVVGEPTWKNWGQWSECKDGERVRKREPTCTTDQETPCPTGKEANTNIETEPCSTTENVTRTETVEPWGEWSEWSDCSKSCRGSTRTRSRDHPCLNDTSVPCPDGSPDGQENCNNQDCGEGPPDDSVGGEGSGTTGSGPGDSGRGGGSSGRLGGSSGGLAGGLAGLLGGALGGGSGGGRGGAFGSLFDPKAMLPFMKKTAKTLCKMLMQNSSAIPLQHTNDTAGYLHACGRFLMDDSVKNMQSVRTAIKASKPQGNWTCGDWKHMLKNGAHLLRRRQLKMLPSKCLSSIMDDKELFQKLSKMRGLMGILTKKLSKSMGNVGSWDATKMKLAKNFLGQMALPTLENLNSKAVKGALGDLKNVIFKTRHLKAAMAKKVLQALGGVSNASNWKEEDIVNSDQYIRSNPRVVAKLNGRAFKQALRQFGKKKIKRRTAVLYARRMKKLAEFKNPSNLTSTELNDIGTMLGSMGLNYVKNIPKSALSGSLDAIKKSDMTRAQRRAIMKKLKEYFVPAYIVNVDILGNILGGMKAEDLKKIPAESFTNVTELKALDLATSQRRVILSKLSTSKKFTLNSLWTQLGRLMEVMMRAELTKLTFEGLGLQCNNTDSLDMRVTDVQAYMLFDIVKKAMERDESNYTGACFEHWGCFARRSISISFLSQLPENDILVGIAAALTDKTLPHTEGCVMRPAPTKYLADKLVGYFNLTDKKAVADLDDEDLNNIANFIPFINEKIWLNFSPKQLVAMTPAMGTVRGVSKDTYASLAKLVLKNVINDSDNTVDKTNKDTKIEGDDLADMGVLRCYLSVFEIGRMTVDALERNLGDMQSCPFSVTLGKKLFERYSLLFKDIVKKKEDIVRGAGILHYITEDALKNADQGALADSYADVVEALEEKHRRRRERDRDGFKEDMSREDRLQERTLEFRLLSPFIRAVVEQEKEGEKEIEAAAAAEATTASGMRRRATGVGAVLTCSYIEIAGAAARALDSKLLASLSSTEFTDCAELLGDIDGWSSEQLVELGKLAKAAWGQPMSWTPEVLLNAGNILATLTVDEIGQLNLNDVDALSAAATSTLFTCGQRAKLFATWLSKAKNNMTNKITAEDILSLGKIACGATAANIDGISDLVYMDSIAVWGSINTCRLEQRKAIARKVNSCFPPNATTWTVSILRQIGSAVVELPEKTLKLIPPRLVSDIPANHIKLMRPEMFSKFTVDQLSAMTVEQKSALTSEQKKALTPAKLKAVTGVNGKYVGSGSNEIDNKGTQSASDQGAAMLMVNVCVYRLLLISLACLLHYL